LLPSPSRVPASGASGWRRGVGGEGGDSSRPICFPRAGRKTVLDLVYVLLTLAFFALGAWYVGVCDRL
jgi:hypothetical protein